MSLPMPPVSSSLIGAFLASSAIVAWGLSRNSLSPSGGAAAFVVGFVTMMAGVDFGVALVYFFVSSSLITKFGHKRKAAIEDGYVAGGRRSAVQVLANGLTGTVAAGIYWYHEAQDCRSPLLLTLVCAFIGHYGCCIGDTWASELGVLSKSKPILLTTLRTVPTGTNGAISLVGTLASIAGGLSLGIVFYVTSLLTRQPPCAYPPSIIVLGLLSGLVGSLLDSLLGATVQASYFSTAKNKVVNGPEESAWHISGANILDNHQVNFVSSLLTAVLLSLTSVPLLL